VTLRDHKAPPPQTKMKNKPTTKTVVTESSDSDISDDDGDVPLDEVASVEEEDEELRPRQKIEVDDKVHIPHY
jgi:hypothetical protein